MEVSPSGMKHRPFEKRSDVSLNSFAHHSYVVQGHSLLCLWRCSNKMQRGTIEELSQKTKPYSAFALGFPAS